MIKSTQKHWSVREAVPDDLPNLRNLYKQVWGYNRPEAYDRWRYLLPPHGLCPIMLALDADRLVGAYTLWPVRLKIGDEVVFGAQSMDTMTHPDYQGQGIFTRLATACFELAVSRGIEVLYGFPNPKSYPGFVGKLDWCHIGDVIHWVRPVTPSGIDMIPTFAGSLVDLFTQMLPRGGGGRFLLSYQPPDDQELWRLFEEWPFHNQRCAIFRSQDWIRWRYDPNCPMEYEWISAFDGAGHLAACAVWGMHGSLWGGVADNRAHLTELLGTNQLALRAVLAEVISKAHARRALVLETLTNNPIVESVLRRALAYRHRRAPMIVKVLTNRTLPVDVLELDNWSIIGGDIDTF